MSVIIPENDYFLIKPGWLERPYLSKNPENAVLYLHDHAGMSSFLSIADEHILRGADFPNIPFVVHGGLEASVYVKRGAVILEANINRIYSSQKMAELFCRTD